MTTQRVLITNDDGIAAPGIRRLARAAADQGFDVVVAAPSEESSGISAAMTAVVEDGRVVIDRRELASLEGIPTFAVSASPGYIVTLGRLGSFLIYRRDGITLPHGERKLEAIGPPFTIDLQGINTRRSTVGNSPSG